jgi:limonene 1,2-monooxygenase
MARMGFGAFLAPHHPIGENPTLQFRRDLKFVEHLDELGYDEFWCGEHHSSGWEMIASPEMFLAAAGERTKRIKLGTGVVSLPYHHPYNVAQRMVQLDHMTGGRAIFGSGPGALPSDAHTLGIDPMTQRDRQDDAIGVIRRLFKGERVTKKTEWYTLQDAALQLLPLQEDMEFVVASQVSPSGMTLAGKYGIGIISLGSMSSQGLLSLPTQWGFAEQAAAKHGTKVDRKNWRVLLSWHVAETREKAREEAKHGLMKWHNEYIVGTLQRPGDGPFSSPDEAVDKTAFEDGSASVIGTPDDLVKVIKDVYAKSGGFGTVVGFVHDWANIENTMRSWDMVARYVIPEINGYVAKLRESQKFLIENRAVFDRAGQAIMAKIMENKDAVEALKVTESPRFAAANAALPKLLKEKEKEKEEQEKKGKQQAAE